MESVRIVAVASLEKDRLAADFLCSGKYDEIIINGVIARLKRGGTVVFSCMQWGTDERKKNKTVIRLQKKTIAKPFPLFGREGLHFLSGCCIIYVVKL